jgi:DNA-binding XRE family transcriptional regulator
VTGYGPERRDLGRRLAAVRKAAGYTQQQLAAAAGYSRSTVSNAEIGHPDVARTFWARCDEVLNSGQAYTLAFDQVRAMELRQAAGLPAVVSGTGRASSGPLLHLVSRDGMAEALAGYQDLGWPAVDGDNGAELLTGDVLDALELPRAAGMLAASLWLYSQGQADDARRLPALPHPARSMAVITAGDRCFFLAAAGCCPWTGSSPGPDAELPAGAAAGPVIRWHAAGGRVPAPPSRLPGGNRAAWAHLPSRPVLLAPPASLLALLATAAASAGHGPPGLTLPGGIRLIPAAGRP